MSERAKGKGAAPVLSGGLAIKQAIHAARARTELTSDMQLALRAGVHYDTLMNWYGNRTTPRPHEVKKIADVLGIRYDVLMAAWEGRDLEPPPIQDAIRELVLEMRLSRAQQDQATLALLEAVAALARSGPGRPGSDDDSEREEPAGTARR